MIRILATALLALSLTASGAFATSWDDLVYVGGPYPNGLYHKKFTDVPFTGKVDEGLRRVEIKNGKQEGPLLEYNDNGQLKVQGAFKNGEQEGPWVRHFDSGELQSKGAFKNGKKEGP
jgi:antitoxin component YwqK of YwqJK toxin-antitoxin module